MSVTWRRLTRHATVFQVNFLPKIKTSESLKVFRLASMRRPMIRFTNKTFVFHASFKDKKSRCKRIRWKGRSLWHCSRLIKKKKKNKMDAFHSGELGVLWKKREKLDSPFKQIGSSLLGMLNLEEPVVEKSLESGQEEGKLETRWPRRRLSKSSQLMETTTYGSVIWSKLPSHTWLPAELMLLV